MVANLLVVSVGVMMTAIALFTEEALAAGLFYMVHSTLVVAALFLLVEMIADERGAARDALTPAPQVIHPALLGTLFFVAAAAIGGLPPFGGFLGKVYVLQSASGAPGVPWIWGIVLGGSLLGMLALARSGSVVFWKTVDPGPAPDPGAGAGSGEAGGTVPPLPAGLAPTTLLLGAVTAVALLAGPLAKYTDAAAAELADPSGYIQAVMEGGPLVADPEDHEE
jgi:multicomponent K+:H+ antiporter subunit D